MTKLKHTLGPWSIVEGHITNAPRGIRSLTKGVNIINFNGFARPLSPDAHYNSLLIAAAPDMLDALIEVMKCRYTHSADFSFGKIESATGNKIEEVVK